MAGAGISGGQVYGASDKTGGYPAVDRLRPHDLVATIFHLLGIGPHAMFADRTGRVGPAGDDPASRSTNCWEPRPATMARVEAGGDLARVPPYDPSPLLNVDFESPRGIVAFDEPGRIKGWKGDPLLADKQADQFGLRVVRQPKPISRGGERHVVIGYGTNSGRGEGQIAPGARVLLTQQVRAPQAGQYTFSVYAAGGGTSAEYYRDVFLKHFVCRLKIFGYADDSKNPRSIREYASVVFQPLRAGRKAL